MKIKKHNHGLKIEMKNLVLSSCFCVCKNEERWVEGKSGLELVDLDSHSKYIKERSFLEIFSHSFKHLKNVFFNLKANEFSSTSTNDSTSRNAEILKDIDQNTSWFFKWVNNGLQFVWIVHFTWNGRRDGTIHGPDCCCLEHIGYNVSNIKIIQWFKENYVWKVWWINFCCDP